MPIATEHELPRADMDRLSRSGAACGVCGGQLTVAWGGENGWMLRCGRNLDHGTMRGVAAITTRELEAGRIFRKMNGTDLTTLSPERMLTERMAFVSFPQNMPREQRLVIAKIAVSYGLDPLMNELILYQGQPFVSLAARLRKAQETEHLDGVTTRPATLAEKEGRGLAAADYLFLAEVWHKGSSKPYTGWGTVKKAEIDRAEAGARHNNKDPYFLPLVKDPASMAEKRAIAKGLKLAFHLPLPSAEDIGGDGEAPHEAATPATPAPVVVEGMGVFVESTQGTSAARDPATIKTLGECWRACHEDFNGMQPKDCLRELGVGSQAEITLTPAECYCAIRKVKDLPF